MSGYRKTVAEMSFVNKDDDMLDKYNEIWDKIKNTLNIKFHSLFFFNENISHNCLFR